MLFGISVPVAHPLLFVLAVVSSILSIALIGFLLSVAVVRYRTAWAMGNLLEYPGWLLCGFLIPVALFPTWVGWISYALPPTWGMRAIREAADGGEPWVPVLVCLGLGLALRPGRRADLRVRAPLRPPARHAGPDLRTTWSLCASSSSAA